MDKDLPLAGSPESTYSMRGQLKIDGVSLPGDEEQLALSKQFNLWLEDKRHDDRQEQAHTWFNLFHMLDDDGDGQVTFDEVRALCANAPPASERLSGVRALESSREQVMKVVRIRLRKDASVISDAALQALWCSLDKE